MKFSMANQPGLLDALRDHLATDQKLIDIEGARSYVSSPRLMDFSVRNFPAEKFAAVGDTFLDKRTMFADSPQKTYGIFLGDWEVMKPQLDLVDAYSHNDTSVINVQVWAFDPCALDEHQTRLAVALSYTRLELYAEPRIIGALNDVLEDVGLFVDCERY
ncbi:hypothetical protein KJF94_18370 [Pseudomonas hormoni]|uniref:Uncharacterized protein n=1 Tax=Pseudomonas hormoni TaxID=3093767 RepID=A0ABX8EQU0_9PSED|nr:hypothetical protein [Pseudomonas hormoni]QVW21852.1 hypothetical protein KJF94_18370 [Pseudomonas hormoni]